MTRFVGDAIGVRSGGGGSRGPTKAQRAKALEEFQRTGHHPELAGAREAGPAGLALGGRLPDRLLTRPHVFLDVEGGGKKCACVCVGEAGRPFASLRKNTARQNFSVRPSLNP